MTLFLTLLALAGVNNDDINITDRSDSATFIVGRDTQSGALSYTIDRKTGYCFVQIQIPGGIGVDTVDCKPLKKYPEIKHFLKTGKVP